MAVGSAQALLESVRGQPLDALADLLDSQAEWWAAGDRKSLPWAGTFIGPAGFREFLGSLRGALEYQQFDIIETIDGGHTLAQIIQAAGVCRANGRRFESVIARTFEEGGGRIIRVRSLYDTAAYERALRG